VHKSVEARDYINHIQNLNRGRTPLKGEVSVQLAVYRPQRRGDLDNTLKVVLDSLRGIAYVDDSQIVQILARRYDDKERPRVELIVTPFEK
jgi:Holliday junction resolvase RusA-like endonuclease